MDTVQRDDVFTKRICLYEVLENKKNDFGQWCPSFSQNRLLSVCLLLVLVFFTYVLNTKYMLIQTHSVKEHNNTVMWIKGAGTQCTIKQMMQGVWRRHKNISPVNIIQREEKDKEIRMFLNLPAVSHRDDGRCGSGFPLNNSATPSLCDAKSSTSCCHNDKGKCGSGPEYCSCTHCTDSRKEISAELYEYVVSGCVLRNYTSKEACELLNKEVSSLTLMGDSLVRHLHNALMLLLTNNQADGALKNRISVKQRQACKGEYQFVDSGKSMCHTATTFTVENKLDFCEGRSVFNYSYVEAFSLSVSYRAFQEAKKILNVNNSILAIGVGLHMNLEFEKVKQYLQPIIQLKIRAKSKWPLIIWITTHSQGSLKNINYYMSQSNKNVLRLNENMRGYLQHYGVPIFDAFNITLGIKSYDGVHYGQGLNQVKANLFLNFLLTV